MKVKNLKVISTQVNLLGHNKRLEITTLLQGHSLTVGQIAKMTALRQATVSQHLTVLRRAKLVKSGKSGKEVYYSLLHPALINLAEFFHLLTKSRPLSSSEPTVIDPICHMNLKPSSAAYTSTYNGVRHYFCGRGCYREFNSLHQGAK